MPEGATELLAVLGALAVSVWAATETLTYVISWFVNVVLKKDFVIPKDLAAVILGCLTGAIAHGNDWVHAGDGAWGWLAAIFFGLVATVIAGASHDKVIKPVTKRVLNNNK